MAANMAAALAATAVLVRDTDLDYATECLTRAKQVYGLAEAAVERFDPDVVAP